MKRFSYCAHLSYRSEQMITDNKLLPRPILPKPSKMWLFFAFSLVSSAAAADLCGTCDCNTLAATINIDCSRKALQHVDGEWPAANRTTNIKASFAGNDVPTLEALPATAATLEVVLSNCKIQYLRPSLFADTVNIKYVDLSHNLIPAEEISSEKFKGAFNENTYEPLGLEHLDLSYNQIHTLGKNVFDHMPELRILNLEGNDFKVIDVHTQLALSSLRKLESLNLANNELTEIIGNTIQGHDNLRELDLSLNELDFVPRSLAQIGKSLEILRLDSNPIIEFVPETFLGLGNITELSCNNLTKLKYINANTFAPMPKLKKLSLSNNFRLADIDREAFGINQTLEELYLNNNVLYRIDYKLLPWSQLHVFEFKENSLECSCDLHNISLELSNEITRAEDGPFCLDPRTDRYLQVFYLKSDICDFPGMTRKDFIEFHYNLVKIAIIILSMVVTVGAILAAVLGYFRFMKYRREQGYSYASQVMYGRVETAEKF